MLLPHDVIFDIDSGKCFEFAPILRIKDKVEGVNWKSPMEGFVQQRRS